MSPEVLSAVIVALISLAGGGGIIAWRRDRRQGPIERRQADAAAAQISSQIVAADIAGLRDIITELRDQGRSLRKEVADLRGRVEQAEVSARSSEARAVEAERRAEEAERRSAESDLYIEDLLAHWPVGKPPPKRRWLRST